MNIFYSLFAFICNFIQIILHITLYIYMYVCNLLFITIYDIEYNYNENYYNNDNNCPICYENKINSCCIPCGHTYCDKCIKNTDNCYICRRYISRNIKIFI
jgi:hypothetical protein